MQDVDCYPFRRPFLLISTGFDNNTLWTEKQYNTVNNARLRFSSVPTNRMPLYFFQLPFVINSSQKRCSKHFDLELIIVYFTSSYTRLSLHHTLACPKMFCFKSIAIDHFIVWLKAQLLKRLPSVSFTVFRFRLIHVMSTRGSGVFDTSIRDESTSET